jgi:DNA-binding transcriptional LysR family regulator
MHPTANDDDDDLWRRLDWNDVRIFLAVSESGSLNSAAKSLGITQPTISRRMEDLEYRLGARLFNRSPRGVSLTDAGSLVRNLASSMARFGGAIMREVAGRDRVDAGRVRIAAPDGLGAMVLTRQLSEFQRANPEIQVTLDCGLWPEAPLEGETDLSLDFSETMATGVVSTPIATVHYAWFASREYLDLYGEPKNEAEVAQHRIVRHTGQREQIHTWNPKLSAVNALAGSHFVSNSSAATLMAIKGGVGMGVAPTLTALFEPDLVMLDLEPMAHPLLYLRHDPAAVKQSRVLRVKEWLLEVFDPLTQPWYRPEFVHPRDFERFAGAQRVRAAVSQT